MGYRIIIGNAVETPDGPDIETVRHDSAPAFPGDDDCHHVNERAPSYSAWTDFANSSGLHGLFFHPDHGLMANHPGIVAITPAHVEAIRKALRHRLSAGGPGQSPGFGDGLDYTAARLLWLDYWMRWALENCERPALRNT